RVFLETLLDSGVRWEISDSSKIHFYSGAMAAVPAEFVSLFVSMR
ncbi:MAG: hypothetical protein RLZZ545_358, partial [Actinomycetota bacterium]